MLRNTNKWIDNLKEMVNRADIITQITLLSSFEKAEVVTQSSLAQKANILHGFVNIFQRTIRKGYVKVNAAPYKRFFSYMTPEPPIFNNPNIEFLRNKSKETK